MVEVAEEDDLFEIRVVDPAWCQRSRHGGLARNAGVAGVWLWGELGGNCDVASEQVLQSCLPRCRQQCARWCSRNAKCAKCSPVKQSVARGGIGQLRIAACCVPSVGERHELAIGLSRRGAAQRV